jgi:hypothetical protein
MKIVTHPGKAHRDEFLACCLILHRCHADGRAIHIERRLVHVDDLADPETWVVDTGEDHDPTMLNFDHHQLINSERCALDLVMIHLYGESSYELYKRDNLWLHQTSLHDIHGGAHAASRLGLNQFAYKSLRSPVEQAIMSRFEKMFIVAPESYMHHTMLEQGRVLHASIADATTNVMDIFADVPVTTCGGVRVMDIRNAPNSARMTRSNTNRYASIAKIDVSIGLSSRSSGCYALYRFPWATEKVDFKKITLGEVSFVHQSGHYAVVGTPSDMLLSKMIQESLIA